MLKNSYNYKTKTCKINRLKLIAHVKKYRAKNVPREKSSRSIKKIKKIAVLRRSIVKF